MSGHVPKLYFVTINVNSNSGLDIMQFMQKLNALLDDYRNATQVLYKFKVCYMSLFYGYSNPSHFITHYLTIE